MPTLVVGWEGENDMQANKERTVNVLVGKSRVKRPVLHESEFNISI